MGLIPDRWHSETWFCSMGGHVVPAAGVAELRPGDESLGMDLDDGSRIVRCVRCDLWLRLEPPAAREVTSQYLPPLDQIDVPLRGQMLRDRIIVRAIALERALHVVLFATLGLAALMVQLKLPVVQSTAAEVLKGLQATVDTTARGGGNSLLVRELTRLTRLQPGALWAVIAVSFSYAVLEAIEAVFLWRGRRWAEYLTVVATASLLPFEVMELRNGVSPVKVVALVLNLAILVWLVWRKRLFGFRGGAAAAEVPTDVAAVLATALTSGAAARLRVDHRR